MFAAFHCVCHHRAFGSGDDCIRILRNCRTAMNRNARLLIVEQIIEPDPTIGRSTGYLVDTQMMAMFGSARERTEPEFRELFGSSGFALERALKPHRRCESRGLR